MREVLKVKWRQCVKRKEWLISHLSDKWELTNGFSILEVLDKLESYFSGMLRKKTCLEWIQEQVGWQKVKIMSLDDFFEEFCSKEVREMRQMVVETYIGYMIVEFYVDVNNLEKGKLLIQGRV